MPLLPLPPDPEDEALEEPLLPDPDELPEEPLLPDPDELPDEPLLLEPVDDAVLPETVTDPLEPLPEDELVLTKMPPEISGGEELSSTMAAWAL